MHITDLSFRQFRNYGSFDLHDVGELVVFHGPNAAGKTNILEGIHLLTAASSFRHPQIAQLIRDGGEAARLQMKASDGDRLVETTLALEPGKRRYQVNGKNKTPSEVRGILPAVTFVPDDLELAKKSSSVKRSALDSLGVQLNRNYDVVLHDYEKALRYKNRLLKEDAARMMVEAVNDTLVTVATQLYCYRRALYERMVPLVRQSYDALAQSGEQFSATYTPSWLRMQRRFPNLTDFGGETAHTVTKEEVRACFVGAYEAFIDEEMRARRSYIGPHNDEIVFYLDESDSSNFASQGQQRSIVLAWKLAEVQMVKQTLHTNPVLLLDDVMSELDATRRDMLVRAVGDEIQTFVTTTDLTPFNATLLTRAHQVPLP